MSKRAEELACLIFNVRKDSRSPLIMSAVEEATAILEQYGRECLEAAADECDKRSNAYGLPVKRDEAANCARTIRQMDLP